MVRLSLFHHSRRHCLFGHFIFSLVLFCLHLRITHILIHTIAFCCRIRSLSVYRYVCRSIVMSVVMTVCLSVYRCLSVCLSLCLSFCISLCLSVYLSVCRYFCLSACLLFCLSVKFNIHLSIFLLSVIVDCGNELIVLHPAPFFTTLFQRGALHVNIFPFKCAIYEKCRGQRAEVMS